MRSSRQDILSSLKKLKGKWRKSIPSRRWAFSVHSPAMNRRTRAILIFSVEFSKPVGFVTFMRLENFLSERLGKRVDLVTSDSLKPVIRQDVLSEVIYV